MSKVVYVTGCLGFIGSYLTRTCLEKGWHVFGIDKCTYASNLENLKEFQSYSNFRFEQKDIKRIQLPSTLTFLGHYALSGNKLEYINIPDRVIKIGVQL